VLSNRMKMAISIEFKPDSCCRAGSEDYAKRNKCKSH